MKTKEKSSWSAVQVRTSKIPPFLGQMCTIIAGKGKSDLTNAIPPGGFSKQEAISHTIEFAPSRAGDRYFLHVANLNHAHAVETSFTADGVMLGAGRVFCNCPGKSPAVCQLFSAILAVHSAGCHAASKLTEPASRRPTEYLMMLRETARSRCAV